METLKPRDLFLLLGGALLLRILHLAALGNSPLWSYPQIDARLFWESALAIAAGSGAEPVYYKPPALAWLLALCIRAFGDSPGAARICLSLLSALAAPLTALVARQMMGRGAAIAAGAVAALYVPAIFYGAELLPASGALLLNLVLLLLLLRAEAGGGARSAGAAGLALGLSALFRPTILLFLPLLLLRYRRKRRLVLPILFGTLIALSPATIHNLRGGVASLVSTNGGINFYLGNHAGSDGKSASAPGLPNEPRATRRASREIAEARTGREHPPGAVSRYWFSQGRAWIASDPAAAFALLGRKLYYLVNAREISDNIDFYAVAAESPVLRLIPLSFWPLFALSLAGLATLRRSAGGRLLLLYGLSVALPPLLFFVVGRFRLPLLPLLAVGAVAGCLTLYRGLRARERSVALPLAAAILGAALSLSGFLGVRADSVWHYHYLCGDVHYRQGDPDGAIAAFESSLRMNPDVAMTMNSLAFLYAETGTQLDRALALIDRAIEIEPERERFYLDSKGWLHYKRGELDLAEATLRRALDLFHAGEDAARAEAEGHLALVLRARAGR